MQKKESLANMSIMGHFTQSNLDTYMVGLLHRSGNHNSTSICTCSCTAFYTTPISTMKVIWNKYYMCNSAYLQAQWSGVNPLLSLQFGSIWCSSIRVFTIPRNPHLYNNNFIIHLYMYMYIACTACLQLTRLPSAVGSSHWPRYNWDQCLRLSVDPQQSLCNHNCGRMEVMVTFTCTVLVAYLQAL